MIYVEATLGVDCGAVGNILYQQSVVGEVKQKVADNNGRVDTFENRYRNSHENPLLYQEVQSSVHYEKSGV